MSLVKQIFCVVILIIGFINPALAEKGNVQLSGSVGIPDLATIQVNISRFKWFHFGFGTGTQPVQTLMSQLTSFEASDFKKDINSVYEVYPEITIGLRSFQTFVRVYLWSDSVYLQTKHTSWLLTTTGNIMARNKESNIVANVGNINISMIQPMLGANFGYQHIFNSGFLIDVGLGAMHMFRPTIQYYVGGLAGSALSASVLDPSIHETISNAQAEIDNEIDEAVNQIRQQLNWFKNGLYLIPMFYLTLGWSF